MRPLLVSLVASAAAFALPHAAAAQDVPPDKPFEGIYVGGAVGFDTQPSDVGETIQFDKNLDGLFGDPVRTAAGANAFSPGFCNGRGLAPTPGGQRCFNDRDDVAYSGRVGIDTQYDTRFGGVVVGVVGEFGKTLVNDAVTAYSTTPASYTFYREVDWEAAVRGRAGIAVGDGLFYGTYGVGYAKIDHQFFTTNAQNAFAEREDKGRWGINAGGGVEKRIGRNLSIGLEYMFHWYDDGDYRVRATQGSAAATNPFVLAPNTGGTDFRRNYDVFRWHSLRGTVGFRF
jgi:outer membrane immunogenic protein